LPEEVPGNHEVDRLRIERTVREILFTIGEGSERKGILGTP
jgi:GTP cyclohydrolase I